MKKVLFVGSSHVGALKIAYDRLGAAAPFEAQFVAAIAADIAFIEVQSDRIAPSAQSNLTAEGLYFFHAEGDASFRRIYLEQKRPYGDMAATFQQTVKADSVSLEGLSAIFYVAGASPYDFLRLEEAAAPLPEALRREALEHLIGAKYPLRPQIEAIRNIRPDIRHAFIGVPLLHAELRPLAPVEREVMAFKRRQIAAMVDQYLFDDVFLPDEALLDDNLLTTRLAYFQNGRQETEVFLGGKPTKSDLRHANGDYGAHVIDAFVRRVAG